MLMCAWCGGEPRRLVGSGLHPPWPGNKTRTPFVEVAVATCVDERVAERADRVFVDDEVTTISLVRRRDLSNACVRSEKACSDRAARPPSLKLAQGGSVTGPQGECSNRTGRLTGGRRRRAR